MHCLRLSIITTIVLWVGTGGTQASLAPPETGTCIRVRMVVIRIHYYFVGYFLIFLQYYSYVIPTLRSDATINVETTNVGKYASGFA